MLGSENLRAFGVDFPVANPDLIDSIHQLRDQIKIETGAAKSRDLSLRSDNHMRVFNRVIEVVPGHCHRSKLPLRHWSSKANQVTGGVRWANPMVEPIVFEASLFA